MVTRWEPREPPLITVDGSFVLDRWRPHDGPALRRFDLDPTTARFFGYSVEQAATVPPSHYDGGERSRGSIRAWRDGGQLNLAIRRRSDGEAVGWVELRRDGERAEVSYNVTAELRGQGIAPRALGALLAWAANQIGLRRARLACHVDNVASRRVAEKCGFAFAGRDGDDYTFDLDLTPAGGPMDVIDWLLDSDPAIRWQVLRDLAGAPANVVASERARVAGEGWGARLLALQRPHGQWPAGTPVFSSPAAEQWWHSLGPARQGTLMPAWTSTTWSLALLRAFGLEPDSAAARHAVGLVRDNVRWEHDGEPYFAGEVEPCINGRTVALGAYFGVDVTAVVTRLLGEQMADGGWNCEQENGSVRGSFHTTIDVLEGLLEHERAAGSAPDVTAARLRGQEYLLERRMFRRLSTGQPVGHDRKTGAPAAWTQFSYPAFWHYDVLRGLDYLRAAGAIPDGRVAEAIELVRSKRGADGRWPAENPHPGVLYFPVDAADGEPSRWNTLRALRVLRWYDEAA